MLTHCPASTSKARRRVLAAAALLASGLAACSGGSTAEVQTNPGAVDRGSSFFFGDPNAGGLATQYRMVQVNYGRLVELFGRDATGARVPMGSDFVIGQRVITTATDYTLQSNPVTGQEILVIERDVTTDAGRAEFLTLARSAADQLDLLQVRDLDSASIFSLLPRNAAIVVTFDDLLNPGTIDSRTVQLRTGLPPAVPFEPRVFPSQYFGAELSNGDFYPTRVVLDLTTSEIEAFSVEPPLPVNGVGAPASFDANNANAQLRVPSRLSQAIGVTEILRNLAGNSIATSSNGPVDFNDATQPVTRAFRTGGRPDVISDPFNGFLRDEIQAQIVGSTPVNLVQAPDQVGTEVDGTDFVIPTMEFLSTLCRSEPEIGDVVAQSGVFAEIVDPGTLSTVVANGYDNVTVRLLLTPPSWPNNQEWENVGQGNASFETAFDSLTDVGRASCYVQVVPTPRGFPNEPVTGISTDSLFEIRFSEPMDPTSLTAFDSMTLTRSAFVPGDQTPTADFVVGTVDQTADLRSVTFVPQQLLAHVNGQTEPYFLRVANEQDDTFPPKDLAGNPARLIPEIPMTVDPTDLTVLNGGRVSRFTSIDEEAPVGAEFGGQVLIDLPRQLLRPRPVITSQVVVDNAQPIMQQMTFLPGGLGLITPHTPFGSKMQTIWRYADCSFSLMDKLDQNIDISGLSWAPSGGGVSPDGFDQFEIRLAHSQWTPDEDINPASAFPRFPFSGIKRAFGTNIVSSVPADAPSQVVVHERSLGYQLDPGNLFVSGTGTTLLPFPLNRGVAFEDRTYFTWRDGDNRARGGGGNAPVDPLAYWVALGQGAPQVPVYTQNNVQSVGLPLLMEFRVFPDSGAVGINGWDFNIAVNSSSRPYFRAFSSGGNNQSGTIVTVNPDAAALGSGGFSPGSNPPGAITPPQDNVVHLGAIDYITRVSHSNSVWFVPDIPGELGTFGGRVYSEPKVEPDFDQQPVGTSVTIRYRGAIDMQYLEDDDYVAGDGPNGITDNETDDPISDESPGIPSFMTDALLLDIYGDFYNDVELPVTHNPNAQNPGITFLGPNDFWKDSVDEIRDARFYQIRMTFVGNPENGLSPEVSAFAFTWAQP